MPVADGASASVLAQPKPDPELGHEPEQEPVASLATGGGKFQEGDFFTLKTNTGLARPGG